jgi:hypothetical protein
MFREYSMSRSRSMRKSVRSRKYMHECFSILYNISRRIGVGVGAGAFHLAFSEPESHLHCAAFRPWRYDYDYRIRYLIKMTKHILYSLVLRIPILDPNAGSDGFLPPWIWIRDDSFSRISYPGSSIFFVRLSLILLIIQLSIVLEKGR